MPKRRRARASTRSLKRSRPSLWSRLWEWLHPQPSNHYRSKLLHPRSLLTISFLVVAGFALFNAVRFFPSFADRVLGYASNITVEQLLVETNQARVQAGATELTLHPDLNQAALAKAQDMLAQQYWAHVAPDGKEAWDFIKAANYSYRYAGENLARDFANSSEVVQAWLNSPTHRDNLLNGKFTQMGLAVVSGSLKGFNTTLVVQIFATPSGVTLTSATGEAFQLPKIAEEPVQEPAAQGPNLALVAGEQRSNPEIVYSSLNLTRTFFLVVVMLIILTLLYDSLIASNRRYQRLVGENLAHVALFVTIACLLILFKGGSVTP